MWFPRSMRQPIQYFSKKSHISEIAIGALIIYTTRRFSLGCWHKGLSVMTKVIYQRISWVPVRSLCARRWVYPSRESYVIRSKELLGTADSPQILSPSRLELSDITQVNPCGPANTIKEEPEATPCPSISSSFVSETKGTPASRL